MAAKILCAKSDQHQSGSEQPAEGPAVLAEGAAVEACISAGWCRDTKLEEAPAGAEEDPDRGRSAGSSPRDSLALGT